jgi:hypothetical protein
VRDQAERLLGVQTGAFAIVASLLAVFVVSAVEGLRWTDRRGRRSSDRRRSTPRRPRLTQ